MKYLIFFLILACGKHEVPPEIDFRDIDGDGIINTDENGISKYIADFTKLEKIEGVLTFYPEGPNLPSQQIEFSNSAGHKELSLKMLTHRKEVLEDKNHFTEWTQLKLKGPKEVPRLTGPVKIQLTFSTGLGGPTGIWLIQGDRKRRISEWKTPVETTVTQEEMRALLNNKAFFSLSTSWEDKQESIKSKTYRVYFHDGEAGQVYYVSKKLLYTEFLKLMSIEHFQIIGNQELFNLSSLSNDKLWWSKEISEDVKVVVKALPEEVSSAYLKAFRIERHTLVRENGGPAQEVVFTKPPDSRVYIVLEGKKSIRSFGEKKEVRPHIYFSGGMTPFAHQLRCTYFSRFLEGATEHALSAPDYSELLIDDLSKAINGNNLEILAQTNETWVLKIHARANSFRLSLPDKTNVGMVSIGTYDKKCVAVTAKGDRAKSDPLNAKNVSREAQLRINIEAYIEKR